MSVSGKDFPIKCFQIGFDRRRNMRTRSVMQENNLTLSIDAIDITDRIQKRGMIINTDIFFIIMRMSTRRVEYIGVWSSHKNT